MSKLSRRKMTKRRKDVLKQGKPNFVRVKSKIGMVFLSQRRMRYLDRQTDHR